MKEKDKFIRDHINVDDINKGRNLGEWLATGTKNDI